MALGVAVLALIGYIENESGYDLTGKWFEDLNTCGRKYTFFFKHMSSGDIEAEF